MFEEKDDTIMARWLAGELTEAELTEFEASSEYVEYQKLASGLRAFQKPEFDKEALRAKVWEKIENKNNKRVIRLKPLYYTIGIAASVLLLFGLFFNKVTYSTGAGESKMVSLPDGSEVVLNAKSKLSHKRFFWLENKKVDLKGEGLFIVTKGQGFQVNTASGTISVLGTEFNVKSRNNGFELHCYEGRVRYENEVEQHQATLNAGDAVKLDGNILMEFKHSDKGPLWQSGSSRFSNAQLSEVMADFELYYDINFEYAPNVIQGHFTGTFVHDDLELALKSIFIPMGIAYEISKDQKTIVLNAR
ncbi:MAG: FecR domain-containing protein [Bacteroidota bacterium]